jgi:hypothetical protein
VAKERITWRGRTVAPRTPREAWRRFAAEMGLILTVLAGVLVIAYITGDGSSLMRVTVWWDYLWVKLMTVVLLPVVFGYEIWLLRRRLVAFAKGEIFVDDDELSPDAVPAMSTRKRRETPAQAKRRKAFVRELALVTVVWLFCAGVIGWVTVSEWWQGKPTGQVGLMFIALLVVYPVYVVLSVHLKREKDRGR